MGAVEIGVTIVWCLLMRGIWKDYLSSEVGQDSCLVRE